jgi:hypothetical protein
MKKIILSIALATVVSGSIMAQDAVTPATSAVATKKETKKQMRKDMAPADRAKAGATWAEKKLGLNAQQKADWEAAALARISANQPLRDKLKGSTTPTERKDIGMQIKANKDAFDSKVAGFLTPEQKTNYDQIKQKHMDAHQAKIKAGKEKVDAIEADIEN